MQIDHFNPYQNEILWTLGNMLQHSGIYFTNN